MTASVVQRLLIGTVGRGYNRAALHRAAEHLANADDLRWMAGGDVGLAGELARAELQEAAVLLKAAFRGARLHAGEQPALQLREAAAGVDFLAAQMRKVSKFPQLNREYMGGAAADQVAAAREELRTIARLAPERQQSRLAKMIPVGDGPESRQDALRYAVPAAIAMTGFGLAANAGRD